jgi:hypothetical protein
MLSVVDRNVVMRRVLLLLPILANDFQVVSFSQVPPPELLMHLSTPPYVTLY